MEEEQTNTSVINSNSLFTIDEFESSNPTKRVLLHNLALSNKASEIVKNNPVLLSFNQKELLFFSTEYMDATYIKLPPRKHNTIKQENLCVNTIITRSLQQFDETYKNCSELAQEFLITSTNLAIEGPRSKSETKSDNPFHGLSFEAIPYFDGKTRSDYYKYDRQQISICFQDLPAPLSTNNNSCLVLAHELTHAIDDIHNDLNSCKTLFNNLHTNSSATAYTESEAASTQKNILECAAKIVDDEKKAFTKFYLPDLKEGWFTEKKKKVFYDRAQEWVNEIEESKAPTNVFVGLNYEGKRGLQCGAIPPEFLTFSIEHVFNALNESNTPEDFVSQYKNALTSRLSEIDSAFTPKIKKAALELIKDTTQPHLEMLLEHSEHEQFKGCCNSAIQILEEQYTIINTLLTTPLSIVEPLENPPTPSSQKKRKHSNQSTTNSRHDSSTASRKTNNPVQETFIQETLHSKDDSGVTELVRRMRKRFLAADSNNNIPTTPIEKSKIKLRSNSI